MKRKLAYTIALLFFLVCGALTVCGSLLQSHALFIAGIATLFGGGFLLAVIGAIVILVRAHRRAKEMDKTGTAPDEALSGGKYAAAEGAFAASFYGFRRASKRTKILSVLFITVTLGSVLCGLVLLFFHKFVAAYVCFGCFAAMLFAGILSAVISSYASGRQKSYEPSAMQEKIATVVSCTPYAPHYQTEQAASVYEFKLQIDGKEYFSRHTKPYEAGTKVCVRVQKDFAVIGDYDTKKLHSQEKETK